MNDVFECFGRFRENVSPFVSPFLVVESSAIFII